MIKNKTDLFCPKLFRLRRERMAFLFKRKAAAKKVVAEKPAAKPVAKKAPAKKVAAKPVAKKAPAKKPAAKPVAKKAPAK